MQKIKPSNMSGAGVIMSGAGVIHNGGSLDLVKQG